MKYSEYSNQEELKNTLLEQTKMRMKDSKDVKRQSQRFMSIVTTIIIAAVLVGLFIAIKPFLFSPDVRDNARKKHIQNIVNELDSYKVSHRRTLPAEFSVKQWQQQFIDVHITDDKEYSKDPLTKELYKFIINANIDSDTIKTDKKYGTIYINQRHLCTDNNIEKGGSTNTATLRILLESDEVYCRYYS